MKMCKVRMHHEYEHPKIGEICPCKNVLLLELLEYVWMLHIEIKSIGILVQVSKCVLVTTFLNMQHCIRSYSNIAFVRHGFNFAL